LLKVTSVFKKSWAVPLCICAAAGFALAACATPAVLPEAADASWAGTRWPGTTMADLERGRGVFVSRCQNCHTLPDPKQKTSAEWDSAVAEMAERAHLSSDERSFVARYLATISARQTASAGQTSPAGG
jgi:cytochrome c5